MPKLEADATRASEQAVVEDKPHADTVLDRHDRKIRHGPANAKPQLCQRQNVGIIVDQDRDAKTGFEQRFEIELAF
jgi:hypothetical protein